MALLENAGQFIFSANPKRYPVLFPESTWTLGSGLVLQSNQIIVLAVAVVLLAGLQFIVLRTRIGTAMRAVSFNPQAASLVGINNDVVISFTFGLGSALAVYELNTPDDRYVDLMLLSILTATFLSGTLAGAAASWLRTGTEDPDALRESRVRQGLLAGSVAGAVAGLLLTDFFAVAFFMMLLGPLLGAAGGALGGAVAADHPRKPRPARSWAAGLFVRS